jgi:hypothetical protein
VTVLGGNCRFLSARAVNNVMTDRLAADSPEGPRRGGTQRTLPSMIRWTAPEEVVPLQQRHTLLPTTLNGHIVMDRGRAAIEHTLFEGRLPDLIEMAMARDGILERSRSQELRFLDIRS